VTDDPAATGRRSTIQDSQVATGRGDDGTTGLLYGGRVSKDDPRTEAYGTVDEAVSAIGLARAEALSLVAAGEQPASLALLPDTLLAIQRELFVVAAELAANPAAADRLRDGVTRVTEPMVAGLEARLRSAEAAVGSLDQFVVPGQTRVSALIEVARTIVRRAERRVVSLRTADLAEPGEANGVAGPARGPSWVLPYLTRLADYLWVLAREVEQAEAAKPQHLVASLAGPS
jgi:cob(I)alamin adenosyltransferase